MLLFGEIWHRGQIKKSEFRDVREKSFSTFWFHFFLRYYAFPGCNLSVACVAAIASNACTDSPPHRVNVTSNQNVRKCLPFQLKSSVKSCKLFIWWLVLALRTKLIPKVLDKAGQGKTFTLFCARTFAVTRAIWGLALSCWKVKPDLKFCMNGWRLLFRRSK